MSFSLLLPPVAGMYTVLDVSAFGLVVMGLILKEGCCRSYRRARGDVNNPVLTFEVSS